MPPSTFDLNGYIMEHVLNKHEWHLPFLPPIHLPQFLSLHGLMVLICAAFLIFLFCVVYRKNDRVPSGMTNFLELVVLFIRDQISIAYLGEKDGRKMTPYFCTLFFFILSLNLLGSIPIFATATSNVNVTGALAFVTLCFMFFGSIARHGVIGFIKLFAPSGVPIPILIILWPIEFLGLFIRSFALMIRLFANMLAGHIVIFALLGLVVLLGAAALPAIVLALFVSLFEIGVAFLQAYIFTLFSAIFIGLVYHPQH